MTGHKGDRLSCGDVCERTGLRDLTSYSKKSRPANVLRQIIHWLRIEGMVSELYDVVVLPEVARPMAFGFKTDEIERLIVVGEAP